ncbi:branched-chain-amino-acid aminotransferase, cytosolic [Mastacembelus armatus]|uniref:branched-chain-amino-acid aminotransferase, cytosolic n=1 Tax=Mastacembelus armatus TaxID=205130 RepID=UPI000E45CADE|nr:branched-chain-amino-acid aminotransferase, cytosolic-like [Mastacembelus armatus]
MGTQWSFRLDANPFSANVMLFNSSSLGVKKFACALPYVILCQAGSYFNSKTEAFSSWPDSKYTQVWKGGTADCKMNYECALFAQYEAVDYGCQVLLLHAAGTMNVFLHWINEDGVYLTRKWGEFKVTERDLTMGQLCSALKKQLIKEMHDLPHITRRGQFVFYSSFLYSSYFPHSPSLLRRQCDCRGRRSLWIPNEEAERGAMAAES